MTDSSKQDTRKSPQVPPDGVDTSIRRQSYPGDSGRTRSKSSVPKADNGYDFEGLFSVGNNGSEAPPFSQALASDEEFTRFQSRLRKGKVKLCAACGGVMGRSSRMILSAVAAILLIILGVLLMGFYGFALHFYQPPWYARFALPAAYYIGSIFVGVGILFFFIREKIWFCPKCKEIAKR